MKNGAKRECSILTLKEEECLVKHINNKNRCYQGMNRKEIAEAVIDILKLRKHTLQQHQGRNGTPLSHNSENLLKTDKLSKAFWKRWDTKHQTLTQKRPGYVSIKQALGCNREMTISHLDELIRLGIFTDAKQAGPEKLHGKIDISRIFNHDETPQFVNYGVDPTSHGLVYCVKGDECKNVIRENRESVTIHPFVSLSGELVMYHVIFRGQGVTSRMKMSSTKSEHGVQDHYS